jgi:hypothetical protein
MLSYHNDPAVKQKYVERFAAHRAADAVVQGQGYENGRGCFVGCTLQNYKHSQFPVELGWPEWLAHLADSIFEGLPKKDAPQFGADLLDAVPVGVDLEPVRWHLAIARHERQIAALASNTEGYVAACRAAILGVIAYCKAQLGGYADEEMRVTARSVAESAQSAAWSVVESAQSAAWSVAWSAAQSAESAARSAARSARSAESAESAAAWEWERDDLLEILRAMK